MLEAITEWVRVTEAIIALIIALCSVVAAAGSIIAIWKVRELHIIVNSRLTQLLEYATRQGRVRGRKDAEQEERERKEQVEGTE